VSIGEALTQARRQAGLTVTEVSQQTRIRETIIRGIEHDDYSACGGDFYARGHIRSIARAAGVDPEPLIAEYDAAKGSPHTMTAAEAFEPVRPVSPVDRGPHKRPPVNWTMVLVIALALVLGFLVYHFLASAFAANSHNAATGKAASARTHTRQHHTQSTPGTAQSATHAASATPSPTPTPTPSSHAQTLTPASAAAYGPGGRGDNPERAALAIDHNPASAWHSDWYTSPRFGNLQQGTGLLVRLGHPETITAARISLGGAPGAGLELRVGDAPSLGSMSAVARADGASGTVSLRPSSPARGRYVLVWFTRLPRDSTGTFQVSVRDIKLEGYP
jgi:cytoskeletal protein RodZ